MIRLYDTVKRTVETLRPRDPGRVSMYVCGPTVYSAPHAGHGRFCLAWDVLVRYLRWSGLEVDYASNITDIDDKIIRRAAEEHTDSASVAGHWESVWWEAMDRLDVERPRHAPRATAYVGDMVALIGELVDRGKAYVGGDAVYFSAATVEDYGLLIHQPVSELRAGARVEVSAAAGKREPEDFALWKFAKPGEPTWDSPWGAGRPGWHTECVVMALDLLGERFDLHGGGSDLVFPHHENERAQAVAAGKAFATTWVHSGMVNADGGVKMSKSLGNGLSLTELLETYDPRAYRMLVLQSRYRSPMTVGDTTMRAAARAVEGLDAFAREFADARDAAPDAEVIERFAARMDDDLDTPAAVADLFLAARRARVEEDATVAAAVLSLWTGPLGLRLAFSEEIPPVVRAQAAARDEARADRDWARADAIRDALAADGWAVEDTAAGTVVRRTAPPG